MNKKCVLLYSGGLDSTIAAYVLKDQGVELFPFKMKTPFCQCSDHSRCLNLTSNLGLKLNYYFAKKEYIDIIFNPKHGYGSGMNPCVDCRIFLFKKAKEYMTEIGARFIATGEVIGQRPMSQQMWQMKLIEKEAEVEGLVLRPLSAKLFPETIPEKNGLIERNKLLSIKGRGRKEQIALAKKYGVEDISTGCGCLLTDKNFVRKLKTFLYHFDNYEIEDIELLRYGRHFYFSINNNSLFCHSELGTEPQYKYFDTTKIILGRNEPENKILAQSYNPEKHLLIEPDFPGPSALCYLNSKIDKTKLINITYDFIKKYSKNHS